MSAQLGLVAREGAFNLVDWKSEPSRRVNPAHWPQLLTMASPRFRTVDITRP